MSKKPQRVLSSSLINDRAFWPSLPIQVQLPTSHSTRKRNGIAFGGGGQMSQAISGDMQASANGSGAEMYGVETHNAAAVAELSACDGHALHVTFGANACDVKLQVLNIVNPVYYVGERPTGPSWRRYLDLAEDPEVHFGTFHIPEGAWEVTVADGIATPQDSATKLQADLRTGSVTSHLGRFAAFFNHRFQHGSHPFSVIPGTNFSCNGDHAAAAFRMIAEAWESNGFAPKGFVDYITTTVRYPNTMIDRISVPANQRTRELLEDLGLVGPTVVTEAARYFVIEENFGNNRRPYAEVPGLYYEPDAAGVRRWEDMKLRTLNAAHSVIASLGVLLGYGKEYGVFEAMQDPDIAALIDKIFALVVPSLERPSRKDPKEFADEVKARLRNPNIPDNPFRIAMFASDKIYPRFTSSMFTLLDQGVPSANLRPLAFAVACVLRYFVAVDDKGNEFVLADDKSSHVPPIRDNVALGSNANAFANIIADGRVMGRNLFELEHVGTSVQQMVGGMLRSPGAVRRMLQEVVAS
ncbi:MAG: hypothetical protein U0136_16330 [Bdellovibrionota bacterium]